MRGRWDATDAPKRSAPAFQSSAASTISSWLRATKFHHMTTVSPSGSPPSRSRRTGACGLERDLVAAGRAGRRSSRSAPLARRCAPRRRPRSRRARGSGRPGSSPGPGPARRRAPSSGVSARAGERASPSEPTSTRTTADPTDSSGRSAWCSKAGVAVPRGLGLRHPELQAVGDAAVGRRRLLGVGDAPARGHQVELPRPDELLGADAVGVHHLAVEQPGHRVQADVGMRSDRHGQVVGHGHRPVVVGEAPGADRAPGPLRAATAAAPARRPRPRGCR